MAIWHLRHRCQYGPRPVHCQGGTRTNGQMDLKGWDDMDAWMAAGTAIIVIVPFVLLAIASIRFGVDSRPGISERDHRPWLVGWRRLKRRRTTPAPTGVVSCLP